MQGMQLLQCVVLLSAKKIADFAAHCAVEDEQKDDVGQWDQHEHDVADPRGDNAAVVGQNVAIVDGVVECHHQKVTESLRIRREVGMAEKAHLLGNESSHFRKNNSLRKHA